MYKEEERDPRNGTDETGGGKGAAEGGFRIKMCIRDRGVESHARTDAYGYDEHLNREYQCDRGQSAFAQLRYENAVDDIVDSLKSHGTDRRDRHAVEQFRNRHHSHFIFRQRRRTGRPFYGIFGHKIISNLPLTLAAACFLSLIHLLTASAPAEIIFSMRSK